MERLFASIFMFGIPVAIFSATPNHPLWWRTGRYILLIATIIFCQHLLVQDKIQAYEACTTHINECPPFQGKEGIYDHLDFIHFKLLYIWMFELVWRIVYIDKIKGILLGVGDEWVSNIIFWITSLLLALFLLFCIFVFLIFGLGKPESESPNPIPHYESPTSIFTG